MLREVEAVKEFIESEIDDYSGTYKIEEESIEESRGFIFVTVDVNVCRSESTLYFKVKKNDNEPDIDMLDIFIDMGEGNWENTRTYDYRVKYFWMKVLS